MALAMFAVQLKTLSAAIGACFTSGLAYRASGFKFILYGVATALLIFLTISFLIAVPKV